MTANRVVEHFDVVEDIGPSEFARLRIRLFMRSFFGLLKNDSVTALSPQAQQRLMLRASRWILQKRSQSSLPYYDP